MAETVSFSRAISPGLIASPLRHLIANYSLATTSRTQLVEELSGTACGPKSRPWSDPSRQHDTTWLSTSSRCCSGALSSWWIPQEFAKRNILSAQVRLFVVCHHRSWIAHCGHLRIGSTSDIDQSSLQHRGIYYDAASVRWPKLVTGLCSIHPSSHAYDDHFECINHHLISTATYRLVLGITKSSTPLLSLIAFLRFYKTPTEQTPKSNILRLRHTYAHDLDQRQHWPQTASAAQAFLLPSNKISIRKAIHLA